MRGNPGNLRQAAAAKSAAARARAEDGLRQMRRRGDPITFRGLAQRPASRWTSSTARRRSGSQVEQLRAGQQARPAAGAPAPGADQPGSVIRTLTAQLTELKRRHREEISALKQALEAAHGENLESGAARPPGHRRPAALTASLPDATVSGLPAQTPKMKIISPDNQALDQYPPVLPMMTGDARAAHA